MLNIISTCRDILCVDMSTDVVSTTALESGLENGKIALRPREPLYYREVHKPRKFKGEICFCGHLAVTCGGELLYLRIFSSLSQPNN